ncbi:IclR family transcriptional regulator [Pseudorhodoplanes sinuspersici]|uniref:Uncharacterized protein n=1 Tax=Pseudorhodoplanes sinuspersici TaxID=1235591 RepID=A0A1W6ZLA1_9HYPH|nr:IclR family transcriptional regulator [Pseudorhodoplanes sinuspersici]ARP98017.1 hypothetical protein CAK95_02175 [Pseudorhodoplanes sinuspersici]RKE68228.1 IclR family transcriptional regulator [Pseudorhodoplanes sinuspersici]
MKTGATVVEINEKFGVQTVDLGVRVLSALAELGGEASLADIARSTGLARAKVHRYLVSLTRSEYVEQDSVTSHYRLGGEALRVGLVALQRVDAVELGSPLLRQLANDLGQTALLAVWGSGGPTVVRWFESRQLVTVNVRIGSVLPVLRSATGRVFAAFLHQRVVQPWIKRELNSNRKNFPQIANTGIANKIIDETRTQGLGHVQGTMLPGIVSLSAPVFNAQSELAVAMTVLGPVGALNDSPNGPVGAALKDVANKLSRRLGKTNS